ncbi:hypothetical protein NDU88_005864 [Pleurodeles waltl]|uniref:Secreted protein n=1 Tax=Pleurodeles waltl TaxID=8319 RepID=A0AAV7NRF6_PLEWA|nr:hypothetical protein NDU88_005864 [Pleurodeles waltl]
MHARLALFVLVVMGTELKTEDRLELRRRCAQVALSIKWSREQKKKKIRDGHMFRCRLRWKKAKYPAIQYRKSK